MKTEQFTNVAESELYDEDVNMTSVVSYPTRCKAWGKSEYRGNCDGRLFLNLVLRYGAKSVADPMMGSGTTRDVIEGLNREKGAGIRFWGSDLREGFDLGQDPLPGTFDMVWVHPPYWNMVNYSNDERDLCMARSYVEFMARIFHCLERCMQAVNQGGHLVVLMGDVRRQGFYYPLGHDVMRMELLLGKIRAVIIKVQHNCTSDRTTCANLQDPPITHEYCIVFSKPRLDLNRLFAPDMSPKELRATGPSEAAESVGRQGGGSLRRQIGRTLRRVAHSFDAEG